MVDEGAELELDPGVVRPHTVRLALPAQQAAALASGAHAVTLELVEPGRTKPLVRERSTFVVPR